MATKIQGIKFLYNELRNVVGKKPVEAYHMTVVARTFDALDNSIITLFNAQKVAQTSASVSIIRNTWFMSSLTATLETSHVRVPTNTDGTIASFLPLFADINALTAPVGDVLIDWQQSTDDVTFNSLLTSYIKLSAGNKFNPTVHPFITNALIKSNNWLRCIVAVGSDLSAMNLQIEFGVIQQ